MHEYPLSQIRCLAMKPVHKTNIIVSRCQILLWYQCGLVFYAIYVHICSDTYMSFFLKSYSSHAPAMHNFFFFSFFFFSSSILRVVEIFIGEVQTLVLAPGNVPTFNARSRLQLHSKF